MLLTFSRLTLNKKSRVSAFDSLRTNKSTYWAKPLMPKSEPNGNFPPLVFLHGAGQSADEMFDYLGTVPEEAGVAVLAANF